MMGLPLDFAMVVEALGLPGGVRVWDSEGQHVDGVWREGEGEAREEAVGTIVLTAPTARLGLRREGETSDSGIWLYTREVLYFSDVGTGGVEGRQSYVEYQGYRYRVTGSGFLGGNTNVNLYQCERCCR